LYNSVGRFKKIWKLFKLKSLENSQICALIFSAISGLFPSERPSKKLQSALLDVQKSAGTAENEAFEVP
jgi:hypothetical protein